MSKTLADIREPDKAASNEPQGSLPLTLCSGKRTVTIQIGNSDDKLTQKEWARYVTETRIAIDASAAEVHFFGGAANYLEWQNAAWVIVVDGSTENKLIRRLVDLAEKYRQDSIAYTVGRTHFLSPNVRHEPRPTE